MKKKILKLLVLIISITITAYVIVFIAGRIKYYYANKLFPYSEINLKKGFYYRNGELFTGTTFLIEHKTDSFLLKIFRGKLDIKTPYKNGVKNGISRYYNNNGTISSTFLYKNDVLEGYSESYNDDGTISNRTSYKNGVLDGISESYFKNGGLNYKINYKNGVRDGISENYRDNGIIWWRTPYKNGVSNGIEEWYDENGEITRTILYKNGKEVAEEKINKSSENKTENTNGQKYNGVYTFETKYRRMKITIVPEKWFGWLEDGAGDGYYSEKTIIRGIVKESELYDENGIEKRGNISGNSLYYIDPVGEIILHK